jgi:hypothetical protein
LGVQDYGLYGSTAQVFLVNYLKYVY